MARAIVCNPRSRRIWGPSTVTDCGTSRSGVSVRVEERVWVTRYCVREDRSADTRTAKSACAAAESAAVRGVRAVS